MKKAFLIKTAVAVIGLATLQACSTLAALPPDGSDLPIAFLLREAASFHAPIGYTQNNAARYSYSEPVLVSVPKMNIAGTACYDGNCYRIAGQPFLAFELKDKEAYVFAIGRNCQDLYAAIVWNDRTIYPRLMRLSTGAQASAGGSRSSQLLDYQLTHTSRAVVGTISTFEVPAK